MAKVLISEKVNPIGTEILQAAGHKVVQMPSIEVSDLEQYIQDAEALFVRILPVTRKMMESAPNLKIISKHGVGVDNIDLEAAKDLGITVTTAPGANSLSVAEHAFSLMMSLAKNIVPVSKAYREIGFAAKNYREGVEVSSKTIGIIGCGKIGSKMAMMCRNGFGMKVLIYDPYITDVPDGCQLVSDRNRVLEEADFVSLHCYLSEETHHSIGSKEFSLMKDTAILINCARGPVVDEAELIRALQEGEIAGAGLDVTQEEPLNPENLLFTMENVIVTPHYAPATKEASSRVAEIAAKNIVNFFAGEMVVGKIV